MLSQKSIDFLRDLASNNDRDWFQANKSRYEVDLKKPFENFIGQVIREVYKIDPRISIEPKKAIFRIHRDTRFSKDKSPYKTNVGAYLSPGGVKGKELPGLYLHLDQSTFMLGGGAYFLDKEPLHQVRQHILLNPTRFRDIITHPDFVAKYKALSEGEQNKKLPIEFQEAAKEQPLLYYKQFFAGAELAPETILQADVMEIVMAHYHALKPLNDFLIEAME